MEASISALSVVDIVALALIAIGGIQGFCRGFSGELARLAGAIIAFIGGTLLHEPVGLWVSTHTRLEQRPAQTLAFIATVVIAVLIMIGVRILLKKLIENIFAPSFDKTAGIIAGLLRMSIFTCIFFMIMIMIPVDYFNRVFGTESVIGRFTIRYVPTVERTLETAGITAFKREQKDEQEP